MRNAIRQGLFVLLLAGAAGAQTNAPPTVVIDYFYESGCPECRVVTDEVLPALASRFPGFYRLEAHDLNQMSNMLMLVAYQARLGVPDRNEPVSMAIDYTYFYNGLEEIRRGVADRVERCVEERLAPGWRAPLPIPVEREAVEAAAAERAGAMAFTAVVAGGLIDGLNPCALSTLVFFMSLLGLARVRGRDLLVMGMAFCVASFAVYTALGFGLLWMIHSLEGFQAVRAGMRVALMAALALLAFLSFRDAWRFSRSGKAEAVTLQLPDLLKQRIHGIMRNRLRAGGLVAGGLVIGGLVTLIESVCTGQVYLPTLLVVLRSGVGTAREWALLLIYNLMVIVPLVLVFALVYNGLKPGALPAWSRAHVVPGKFLLGGFFMVMALMLLMLG